MKSMMLLAGILIGSHCFAQSDLTLQEAANLMKKGNPVLSQRALDTQAAKAEKQMVVATYFPSLDFVQSFSNSNNPVYVFSSLLNQQKFTSANFDVDRLNSPDALSDYSSRFQLGWLLYDFGNRENRNAVADTGIQISELQHQAQWNILVQQLVARYYAVWLAHEQIAAAQDTLKSAESRRDQSKERVDSGLSVESDLLSAEVFQSKARQQLIDAENKASLAIASLNEIIGMPNASWKSTTPLQNNSYSSNPLSYWIDQMMNNRAELKIASDSKEIAERQVSITNSQFLPSIQAWSNYQWHGDSFDYTGDSWGAGVELNWNLFRGFSDKGRVSSAKFNSQKAAERVRETENALRLQVESAYYHFLAAQQKYSVTESTLKQAEENRRIYAERYESGLVSIQDSLQADASYSEARLMHLQNLYEIQTAYAELLGACGKADDLVQQKAGDL